MWRVTSPPPPPPPPPPRGSKTGQSKLNTSPVYLFFAFCTYLANKTNRASVRLEVSRPAAWSETLKMSPTEAYSPSSHTSLAHAHLPPPPSHKPAYALAWRCSNKTRLLPAQHAGCEFESSHARMRALRHT